MEERTERHPTTGERTRGSRLLRASPWIVILVLIGSVQAYRAQPFDTALFFAAALAVLLDAVGVLRLPVRAPRVSRWLVAGVVSVLAIVLLVAPRHGVVDGVAFVVLGLLVLPFAWASRPHATATPAVRRAAVAWALVVIAACVLELVNFVWGRVAPDQAAEHPPISDLLNPALDAWVWRALFLAVWLGIGVLLVRPAAVRRPGR